MATKNTILDSDIPMEAPGNDAALEQAIDDLRGVLKSDSDGTLPDLGDFAANPAAGSDFGAGADFGGGFGGGLDMPGDSGFGGGMNAGGFGGAGDFSAQPQARVQEPGSALNANLNLIMDIPIDVQIVLGTSRMQVAGLMNLHEGATISLDKRIGEPVDIVVNGRKIARGEITVMENDDTRFGVKLIEVLSTRKA